MLLLWPAFSHIRRGGSCYSPTTRIRLIWISPTTQKDHEMSKPDDYEERHMPPRQVPKPPPKLGE
ncbi:hypothetical protein F2N03_05805 [Escherichia coli]|nr:hypothetical protein [Escherichia coli]